MMKQCHHPAVGLLATVDDLSRNLIPDLYSNKIKRSTEASNAR